MAPEGCTTPQNELSKPLRNVKGAQVGAKHPSKPVCGPQKSRRFTHDALFRTTAWAKWRWREQQGGQERQISPSNVPTEKKNDVRTPPRFTLMVLFVFNIFARLNNIAHIPGACMNKQA